MHTVITTKTVIKAALLGWIAFKSPLHAETPGAQGVITSASPQPSVPRVESARPETVSSIEDVTPEDFFGSADNLQLVKTAEAVTVFRIMPGKGDAAPKDSTRIAGYACDSASSVIKGPEVTKVVGALLNRANFDANKLCIFEPGVIVRFANESRVLDLIICFSCREIIMYDGKAVRRPYRWGSVKLSFKDDAYIAFASIAKQAFPNDPQMQALKL
jgi:hypothetical protein